MTKVVTEVEAKAKISGDKQVLGAYVQLEQAGDRLASKTQAQAAAAARQSTAEQSLADALRKRSDAADASLQKTEGLFKVTDRVGSIAGKAAQAFGLLGLAGGALKGIYDALTDASEKRAKAEKAHADALAQTERNMKAIARAAPAVIQALGITNFLSLTPEERAQAINLQRTANDETSAREQAEQQLAAATGELAKAQKDLSEAVRVVEGMRQIGVEVPGARLGAVAGLRARVNILQGVRDQEAEKVERLTDSAFNATQALDAFNAQLQIAVKGIDDGGESSGGSGGGGQRPPARNVERDIEQTLQAFGQVDQILQRAEGALNDLAVDDALGTGIFGPVEASADSLAGKLSALALSGQSALGDLAETFRKRAAEIGASIARAEGGVEQLSAGISAQTSAAVFDLLVLGGTLQETVAQLAIGIGRQAAIKLPFAIAEGFAALGKTGGIPNPASAAHFTAAKIYAGIAIGGGLAGAALGGGGGGGGGSAPGGGAFAPTAPAPQGRGGGDTNITLYVETGLATKRDVANAVLDVLPAASRELGANRIPARLMERRR